MKVSELKPGMSGVDIKVRVLGVSEPTEIVTRDGRRLSLQRSEVGDSSGRITLTLWEEKTGIVKMDDIIEIHNGYVTSFRGERQLNVGKYGTIKKVEDIAFPKAEEIPRKSKEF